MNRSLGMMAHYGERMVVSLFLLKGSFMTVSPQNVHSVLSKYQLVDGYDLVLGDIHRGPVVVILALAVGDDRVQIIVAAGKLDHDEALFAFGGGHM